MATIPQVTTSETETVQVDTNAKNDIVKNDVVKNDVVKKVIIDYTKKEFTEEEKCIIRNEIEVIKEKYPNYIPIVVRVHNDKSIKLTKFKFLVGGEITLGQFLSILRKKITNIKSTESIYLLINNTLIPITLTLSMIYKEKRDHETDMLYITICKENTFGTLIKN